MFLKKATSSCASAALRQSAYPTSARTGICPHFGFNLTVGTLCPVVVNASRKAILKTFDMKTKEIEAAGRRVEALTNRDKTEVNFE